MSLINNLQLQEIDDLPDDMSSSLSNSDDEINLREPIDEGKLEQFWDQVVEDVHKDPDWFTFDNK